MKAPSADLAGRPGERAVEHVEDAADEDDDPADHPRLQADEDRPDHSDAEADQRQAIRRQAGPAHGQRDRLEDPLDARPGFVRDGHPSARPEDRPFPRGDLAEGLRAKRRDGLAADAARLDEAGNAERLRWWLTRGWLRPTWAMSSATLASPRRGADDAQPINVGEGLVEGRAARAGRRAGGRSRQGSSGTGRGSARAVGAPGSAPGMVRRVASTSVDINGR